MCDRRCLVLTQGLLASGAVSDRHGWDAHALDPLGATALLPAIGFLARTRAGIARGKAILPVGSTCLVLTRGALFPKAAFIALVTANLLQFCHVKYILQVSPYASARAKTGADMACSSGSLSSPDTPSTAYTTPSMRLRCASSALG